MTCHNCAVDAYFRHHLPLLSTDSSHDALEEMLIFSKRHHAEEIMDNYNLHEK